LWRVSPEFLDEAQDDATLLAIRDQERAGLDIITDGEQRRESYSNRFATALEGVDIDNPGTALDRSGHPNPVPRVTGRIRRKFPVELRNVEFLRANPGSRSPCPARSRWRSRPRTIITKTSRRWCSTMRRP
jgi:5-methyltetrahydropteroyltriglutamate--homocysteine methyltransferase